MTNEVCLIGVAKGGPYAGQVLTYFESPMKVLVPAMNPFDRDKRVCAAVSGRYRHVEDLSVWFWEPA